MNLRVASSFMMCAEPEAYLKEIFSREARSWRPTWVTPMGQGELPMATPM